MGSHDALAMLVLAWTVAALLSALPVSSAQARTGDTCADPLRWKPSTGWLVRDEMFQNPRTSIHFRPRGVSAGREGIAGASPFGGGRIAASPEYELRKPRWRICYWRGTDSNGDRWRIPGPSSFGANARHAGTIIRAWSRRVYPEQFDIAVARQTAGDGHTCRNPFVVIRDPEASYGQTGDTKYARFDLKIGSHRDGTLISMSWKPRAGYRVCTAAVSSDAGGIVRNRNPDGGSTEFVNVAGQGTSIYYSFVTVARRPS